VLLVGVAVVPYAIAAWAVRRWYAVPVHRARLREVLGTIGVCAVAAPAVAAAGCVAVTWALGATPEGGTLWRTWLELAVGESVAIVGLAPGSLLLVDAVRRRRRPLAGRVDAAIVQAVVVAATLATVIRMTIVDDSTPLLYLAFVPFLWVALTQGLRGVSLAALIATTTVCTVLQVWDVSPSNALAAQGFVVVLLSVSYGVGAVVTDRQRAERAAQTAGSQFQLAFDRSAVGMAVIELTGSRTGNFLQANDALCELLGRSAEELRTCTALDLTHPDDLDVHSAAGLALLAGDPATEMVQRFVHADGHEVWCRVRSAVIADVHGRPTTISHIEDVTFERLRLARLEWDATHDHLTGLVNRAGLRNRLAAHRDSAWASVAFVDLDRFKLVNDLHGHDAGDEVLIEVARRLELLLRGQDLVARLGGDEFVVVAGTDFASRDHADAAARSVADRIAGCLAAPLVAAGDVPVGASVGTASGPPGQPVDDLLRAADQAMFIAKRRRATTVATVPDLA